MQYVVDHGLDHNILWGADYPHFDCLYPGALNELREKLKRFPDGVSDLLLRANPAQFYNVDFDA